jgi:hypothetical protein
VQQCLQNLGHIGAIRAHFNAQRPLPGGRQHLFGLEHSTDARRQSQTLQSGGGQYDAVVQTIVKFF